MYKSNCSLSLLFFSLVAMVRLRVRPVSQVTIKYFSLNLSSEVNISNLIEP